MNRRISRRLVGIPMGSLGVALVALLLTASTALGSVTWTSPVAAARASTFNFGTGLARTVSGTTPYLHIEVGSDVIGGVRADDDGPYAGVYYRRGNAGGTTWGTLKRVSPSTQHAYQGAIAASGAHVYVTWMTLAHLTAYDPAEVRTLGFRANDNHGSSAAWRAPVALTTSGRINNPNVAAAGSHVYISYTDSDTGSIMLWSSPDYGTTWSSTTLGSTSMENGDAGFAGWPELAASGSTVAVAWINQVYGETMFTVSADAGQTFSPPAQVGVGPVFSLGIAAKGDRIALAMASEAGSSLYLWQAGSWKRERGFASHDPSGTSRYKAAYGLAVALSGTSTVAVAWSACRRTSKCTAGSTYGVDLLWRESSDNLKSLKATVAVALYSAGSTRRYNEFASVLMPSPSRRLITYTSSPASGATSRLYIEIGKGTP